MDSPFAFLVCKNKANLVYYQTFMDCTMSTISASEVLGASLYSRCLSVGGVITVQWEKIGY